VSIRAGYRAPLARMKDQESEEGLVIEHIEKLGGQP